MDTTSYFQSLGKLLDAGNHVLAAAIVGPETNLRGMPCPVARIFT